MNDRHDPSEAQPEPAQDVHRALSSLKEEIEAVDFYHARVLACADPELKRVLEHNRDEEMEHAAMLLEWLRRHMPSWNSALRTYVFTTMPITDNEKDALDPGNAGRIEGIGDSRGIGSPTRGT